MGICWVFATSTMGHWHKPGHGVALINQDAKVWTIVRWAWEFRKQSWLSTSWIIEASMEVIWSTQVIGWYKRSFGVNMELNLDLDSDIVDSVILVQFFHITGGIYSENMWKNDHGSRLLTAFFGMGTGDQNRNSIGTLVRLLMPQQATWVWMSMPVAIETRQSQLYWFLIMERFLVTGSLQIVFWRIWNLGLRSTGCVLLRLWGPFSSITADLWWHLLWKLCEKGWASFWDFESPSTSLRLLRGGIWKHQMFCNEYVCWFKVGRSYEQ